MLKGVNKLIIEVSNPESEFFERAIFFVKPDKRDVLVNDMSESVREIMSEAGSIRARRQRKLPENKKYALLKAAGAMGAGAAIMGVVLRVAGG